MENKDIEKRFTYHAPNGEQIEKYALLRFKGKELAITINDLVMDCREKYAAITTLEQVIMWANAGIARNE